MSKSKRAKSGSAHDVTRWDTGLVQATLNEDVWKTCIFFLVSNKLEDNVLIDISCEVVSTGLRELFSVITKEGLFKEVKEYAKASGGAAGKGKTSSKLPEFVEICEQVKPFIDQDEDIPPTLLAKLLKFKLLHLKAKDLERRDEAKKEKSKDGGSKKGEKRSATGSPGKRSKSPKKKGKKGESEPSPSPKKDTKLKKRGEVEDNFKTIDDEPNEEGSPQHYILIHGFILASTLQHLANIGVHVNAIIKVKQDEYRTIMPIPIEEKVKESLEVEDGDDDHGVSQVDETDDTIDQRKEEEKLETFWKDSDEVVVNAPTGHKLKDIAKYEVTVSNTLAEEAASNVNADNTTELGTAIFEKIANVCYDMLDHHKSYQRYLNAMKLLHVPLHTTVPVESAISQSAAPSLATDMPKGVPILVETDMRYYSHLVSSVPDESISVPLILHCVLEQVVASLDETNPMDKPALLREDGLDDNLAAHINARTAGLALSAEEKQLFLEPEKEKRRRENIKIPQILDHNDKLSQRLHYLENLSVLDCLETELGMLCVAPAKQSKEFPHRTVAELMETNARFHQFIQHCSFGNPDDVSRLLKKYTFEGMPLKSVDDNGNILDLHEMDNRFCSYKNPWDDPYSDLMKYFSTLGKGKTDEELDLGNVSATVDLVSFRNLDDWCYIEQFDKSIFTQILDEARLTNPYVDTYYHKHDDTLLLVFHNPVGKQLHSHSTWNVRLHSNVGFRNYLEHISNMIQDWSVQQDILEQENKIIPTPVPPTPEPPNVQIKTGSRYGLKTREEIAALKADEEDKGKKKGKRSARSRTPRSGKKSSQASKETASDKKGRTTSGSRVKSSKTRIGHEGDPPTDESKVKTEDDDGEYAFLGYDVGDDLMHLTGVVSSMFPSDGGQIVVEKTRYVHRASTVSTSVYKDGNILKLHFLEPLEELIDETESSTSLATKEESSKSLVQKESLTQKESLEDGVEKSEYEENEKQWGSQNDMSLESTELPTSAVFCKHASFVAQLNDGMVISSSGFGAQGVPPTKESCGATLDASNIDNQLAGLPLDPSPPPKAASPKSRKKNDDEVKRLEELRQAEERKHAENEARRLEELQKALKKPFHEIFVSCPDGLHISYQNDENYGSVDDAGGVVVRQRYPVKSRGLHDCEAVRGKVAMEEKSRCIRTDGTVIKIMLNNSVEVLYPDGMTCRCPVFPSKLETTQAAETTNQPSGHKVPLTQKSDDEPTDETELTRVLLAEWTTVTADGERFLQKLDGSKTYLGPIKLSVATCPVTDQIYKTREDNVIAVLIPNGTSIVEHSDGTRMTTFYKEVQVEVVAADHETGEEAEYESRLCRHVKVECEGFATVVMETEHGLVETLFGNGSFIKTKPNGDCVLNKSDGLKLHFDIKGNVMYVPCQISCDEERVASGTSLADSPAEHRGIYFFRTTSQHCCELTDQRGNGFSVFANGEIKITNDTDEGVDSSSIIKERERCSPSGEDAKRSKDVDTFSSLPLIPLVPRFFVMRRDGTGLEMLRHQDVRDYLEAAENDASTAVLRMPVEGYPGVTGITVLKPFQGGIGKIWLQEKDEKILIPEGLRERDFKVFPAKEVKTIGPKFGTTSGVGLNIGSMGKPVPKKPQLTCPKVLVLRHLIQYEPSDITHRQTISAAFQKYGEYVMKRQLQADNLLPHEPRTDEELQKADELTRKYEPVKTTKYSKMVKNGALSQDYVQSVTPAEEPPAPPPVWKRPPGEWERDRIELAKLDYGKHALRYQEIPPYFETSQGQAFLNGLKNVPDMEKLTADLDKRACPERSPSDLSGLSSPVENGDQGSGTQGNRDRSDSKPLDRYSSAVLENLEIDDRNSPGDQPVQSSTPFANRPVNPTPAQAAGRPTPTSVRPTNPTPRQASNVIGFENSSESVQVNNVQSATDHTPLEALLETRNEMSYEDEECRMDNDTALDLNSSADSHYNEGARVKSLYVDVTGSPRKDRVKLPNAILGGKPGALPNTQGATLNTISQESNIWKFVDDVSLSEGLTRNSNSTLQSNLDNIGTWSAENWMKLNAKKCKEMRISYLRETPQLTQLHVDGQALELVSSYKVLGLIFQNNLKWNEHISAVISKASKRLHILRVLRRGGLPSDDLYAIYTALIRSILEYCCPVWHHALPSYLSDKLERVQKRALRIILPGLSYREALQTLGFPRLDERRSELCEKTLKKISKGGTLSQHLPKTRNSVHDYQTRNANKYTNFKCRTERQRRSFFPSTIQCYKIYFRNFTMFCNPVLQNAMKM